jgi:DNA-binding NarL/FixJ family response regulator
MSVKKSKYIFIVEDNELYSMMLDYILSQKTTYQFLSFKSGEDCLKKLYLNPEIIILDYWLPGINGYDTLLEIKKQNFRIHVIMLSSNKDIALAEKVLRAGADDYILKQGHGETQVINKIEAILKKDTLEEVFYNKMKKKSILQKMAYFILLLVIISLGFFISNNRKG